jgi:hypothetical protein
MNEHEPNRTARIVLTLVILELTAATAYVHLTLGGTTFLLNAFGYAVLGAAYAATLAPTSIVQRIAWLPRIGLGGYAVVTIGAYLVDGTYFPLGWITKAVELAIVALVTVELLNAYRSPRGLLRAAVGSLTELSGRRARHA